MAGAIKKGIILAGGSGTRLYPVTQVACKQLMPIYDKPMVFYPLSTLMLFGITEILVISTPADIRRFENLLGDGSRLGLRISYAVQPEPAGIAQAFLIGEEFIGRDPVALILGDNIFYGVYDFLRQARDFSEGAMVFGYYVKDPERYGVIGFDEQGRAVSIEEKPVRPKSNYAVTGLYLYDSEVVSIARGLRPSSRGELEITDVNRAYLQRGRLKVVRLGRGIAWLDTGTHESMLEAGNFIATIEKRQGQKIACTEEIAYRMGYIDRTHMMKIINDMADNSYRGYLLGVIKEVDGDGW
ncbi:MAG TPA: glucose-1-phosphate thymidylyltransferase RfbA [Acidobacteriota bacterium]|nr:glucose-1-phosphate thymidylyltransferase RfbA [Acidobacteriota bacterium]